MAKNTRDGAKVVGWILSALTLSVVASCGRAPGTPPPTVPSRVVGHCIYRNNFSGMDECRDYLGDGWTDATVTSDCQRRNSTAVLGAACSYPSTLGQCILDANRPNVTRLTFPGADASKCGSTQNGCEFWGGGFFVPSPLCAGMTTPPTNMPPASLPVFRQPEQVCRAPREGEPAGTSAGGQVCTFGAISACTEPGRKYSDYASCEPVLTQRPYWPARPAPARTTPDPRMSDPAYTSELAWARSQIESCGCICCHSNRLAPMGPSNWFVESAGNFMDTFHDTGLALGAGWIDSTSLGAYPREQNNGFSRTTSGIPSTDPERMARFFANELANRGRTRESFSSAVPFGGPIYTQMTYRPSACTGTDGIAADGTISWQGGAARYVYVMEPTAANPGVPPNLDLPTGTIWRIDVPFDGTPINTGIRYGTVPMGANQRFPQGMTAPAALRAGQQYYLYVMQDVGIPVTRCLFTAR
jgi:hypothetical protein